MKRAIVLALVAGVAATLAATAVARPTSGTGTDAQQAVNCKSTLKIAIVTPLTGGAGFLGNAQLSWAKYAVKRLAPGLGLKVQLVTGDTPVEAGSGAGPVAGAEVRRRPAGRRSHRPGDIGCGRGHVPDVLRRRRGAHLAVGDPYVADQGHAA